jgi:hypothetical protein
MENPHTGGQSLKSGLERAWSFLDLVRCRSDRLRHDRRASPVHTVRKGFLFAARVCHYAAAGLVAEKSTSRRQTAQMTRASLLARALTALL